MHEHAALPCAEKVPSAHSWQLKGDVAFPIGENLPAGQAVHTSDPKNAQNPAGHGEQESADAAPSSLLAVPGGQGRHLVDPSASAYVPAAHLVHAVAAASFVNVPTSHFGHFVAPSERE
eukprot:1964558-Rhodomonas_salina.1